MKKINAFLLCLGMALPGMAQQNFEKGKPNDDNYRYLDEYGDLKEYIDRDKYPTFRMGLAIIVNDYLNNTTVRNCLNRNANETVAGNAMKMASCVDGNGNMNFSNVTKFVNTATDNGLEVYGHTLAWHSQQPKGWLLKLLQDKPAPELPDGDVTVYVPVYSKDFRTNQSVGWKSDEAEYGYKLSFDAKDGLKIHCTKKNKNSWDVQFLACTDMVMEKGKTYRMSMRVKGTTAGKLHTKLGDWGGGPGGDVAFGTDWDIVTRDYKPTMSSNFYMLQCGDFVGDIYISDIKFEEQKKGKTINEERRCLKVEATERVDEAWDNQFWLVPGSFSAGAKFEFSADVRADIAATASTQIHNNPGSYVHYEALGNIPFTTDWKTIKLSGTLSKEGKSIAFNLNELAAANNYYFDNVSLKINGTEKIKNGDLERTDVSSFKIKTNRGGVETPAICENLSYVYVPSSIPLTHEERLEVLTDAMDKWIKGMMNACGGKVKAWDVVNEAIAGDGNDGSGNYTLQHSNGYNSGTWDVGGDAFYWQDYMGDLEYVRTAVRLARKYGPEDVKLFINDYNLESFWDDNKKLKSLINWIKKWEADGVTKIDGIGTQMHISCSMSDNDLNNRKKHITQMFKLMAQSGKLCRVSEFDMGMVDASGKTVNTANMTESMHKRMADYYEWIVKQYLTIIPAEQQWGICHWCPTDSPAGSGWRANEPVGIWDINYYRKHAYAGFVRGLGGVKTGIENVEVANPATVKKGIYDLTGRRFAEGTDFSTLPAGVYIVNGKKMLKK